MRTRLLTSCIRIRRLIFMAKTTFAEGCANVARIYTGCTYVKSPLPVAQDAMIPDLNATWPDQKCDEVSRDVSHGAMLADPKRSRTVADGRSLT